MLMEWWSKECPGDLGRKCRVPGTFFTSTKPDNAQPVLLATRCIPLHTQHSYSDVLQLLNSSKDSKDHVVKHDI